MSQMFAEIRAGKGREQIEYDNQEYSRPMPGTSAGIPKPLPPPPADDNKPDVTHIKRETPSTDPNVLRTP